MKATVKGNQLTLVIDLSEEGRASKTGKSTIHFTTGGFAPVGTLGEHPLKASINITSPAE